MKLNPLPGSPSKCELDLVICLQIKEYGKAHVVTWRWKPRDEMKSTYGQSWWCHVPPDRMQWEVHPISVEVFLKMHNPSLMLSCKQHQTDPDWKTLRNTWSGLLKTAKVVGKKSGGDGATVSAGETKKIKLNVAWYFWMGYWKRKRILMEKWMLKPEYTWRECNAPILVSWFRQTYLCKGRCKHSG